MEDFYEHIDDYKNGLLKGEKLAQFETAMTENPSLKLAVDNYDIARDISEGLLEVDMLATLTQAKQQKTNPEKSVISDNDRSLNNTNRSPINSDHTSNSNTKPKTSIFNIRNFMAAASVVGIILIAGWWTMKTNAEAERKEYVLAKMWELRPTDPDATKSTIIDTVGMTSFEKGKYYFARNLFEESVEWLEKTVSEEKEKKLLSEGYFWLGHAYIQVWRVEDAKEAWGESDEEGVEECLIVLDKDL